MNLHEKYGVSEEQLIRDGHAFHQRNSFRNEPFWHQIIVACGGYQWDAITAYHARAHNLPDAIELSKAFHYSGAFHMWHVDGGVVYSVIGLHSSDVTMYSPASLRSFLNAVAHELQHAIIANENQCNINSRMEEEPRAYATGVILSEVLKIASRELNIGFCALPKAHYPMAAAIEQVPAQWVPGITTLAALSGIMSNYMSSKTGLVEYRDNDWTAVTYYSGGNHVQ
ncbi:hypothetical protein pEaSNUABM37_00255 [Erwinia phage pEa_SNUABM_37]|nr:hypothetical protein pEaSNUABM37_00255 [Erwinia phage pEa_SNUABM_37]QXO10723.1 hypothetical protein pEaSNUABM48_00255 [Erwinia phage pEa_SNUABM_48]